MEDDIDIEEHDVLDNPRIRTIFPDIAQIKAEIPDDNYDAVDQGLEYEPYSTDEHLSQQEEEDTSEYTGFGNKIILGSKPTSNSILESVLTFGSKPVEVKQEVEEYEETVEEELPEEHYSQPSTVLILGSKPSSSGVITPFSVNNGHREDTGHLNVTSFLGQEVDLNEIDTSENEVFQEDNTREPRDPSAAVVLVENWGPRLENSCCYCKECEILFPTSNTLLAHNMTAHSFLVALDKNKAVKSTSKPNAKKVETGKLCNHCNKMFPDSDTLINHLYMTFDKNAYKNQPKKVVANPFNKQVSANLAKKREVSKTSKFVSEVQVYAQGATDLFRCEVCSYYCEMYKVFVKHMKDNHSKDAFSQEKEIFDGTCPHCNAVLKSKLVYNRHLQFVHSDVFNRNASAEDLLYRCVICSYYLEVDWALVRHMKHDHSKKYSLNSIKQNKTAFDGKCLHCSSVFTAKRNYNKHMKKVHNNLVKLKGSLPPNRGQIDKTPTPKKIPIIRESNNLTNKPNTAKFNYNFYNSCKFQCQKCGETFTSYDRARQHRRFKHPELKTQMIFKKVANIGKTASVLKARVPTKIVLKYPKRANIDKKDTVTNQFDISPGTSKSPQKNNHPDAISKPGNQIVIPKSIIFKCNKCDVHFTSCTATALHSKSCGEKREDWKCNVCNRLFQTFDQTVHKRQHQVSEKFNVVVYHENIYGRVLNRCPNCKLYFHEKEFYLHDQKKFCRGTGVKCEICSTPIHDTSCETHNEWHERIKNIKKNMIRVEFSSISVENTPSTPVKRVLDMDSDASPLMPPKKAKIEKSETGKKQLITYCQKCGVYMLNSRHAEMHIIGRCKNIPNSYKKICKICGLTHTRDTHMSLHKAYPNLTLMDMKFQSVEGNTLMVPPIPKFPGCNKCKVHFCKKDAVATHNCKDSYKTCKYCKKRYSDLAYKLHMKFHEYQAKFGAIKSLVCNGSNVSPVPQKSTKDPMPELLKKYELLTNTWNILFSCSSCDIVCDNYDKVVEHCQKHFNNMESYDVMIEYCEICKLKFDGSCFERHKALHAQNECVNIDSFIVCSYQYKNLLKLRWLNHFNRVIPATQMQQILSKSIYTNIGRGIKMRVVKEGPSENTIYKCGQCELFVHPPAIASHSEAVSCNKSLPPKNKCRYCGILFCTITGKVFHEKTHKTADSFNVVSFNENGDKEFNENMVDDEVVSRRNKRFKKGKRFQYYRCNKCKCCIMSKLKATTHKCSTAKLIEKCKICHLRFYKKIMSKHITIHKMNPRLTTKNINFIGFEKGPDGLFKFTEGNNEKMIVKLYRCQCGLHFTSTKAIDKHFEVCGVNDDDVIKEKCSKCKRLFDTNQLVAHLCKHHSKDCDKNTEFEITVMSPGDSTKTKTTPKAENNRGISKSDKKKELFKCKQCNVYYLSQGGLAYHYDRDHQVYKVTKCPYCKLQFMPMTLQKHILIHHKTLRCKVTDFIINIGYLHKGTLRVKKSVLTAKRSPCKKHEPKIVAVTIKDVHQNVDLSLYNNKLYKCESCDMHLLTWCSLISHRNRNNHGIGLVKCPDCEYSFSNHSLPKHSYIHHENMKLKREEFEIIYARKDMLATDDSVDNETDCNKNDGDDDEENENNQSPDEAKQFSEDDENYNSVKKSVSLQEHEDQEEGKIYVKNGQTKTYKLSSILYECGICHLICSKSSIIGHVKGHLTNEAVPTLHKCPCGLNFTVATIAKHENLHHGIQNFTRDDLYTITMNNYDGIIGSNHLFRCEICLTHFGKMHALENHLLSVEHSTSTTECPECGLPFSMSGVAAHVKLHHNAMKLRPEDIVVLQSVGNSELKVVETLTAKNDSTQTELKKGGVLDRRLYKCSLCTTHYLNSDVSRLCEHDAAKSTVCEKCLLKFGKDTLEAHIETHHTSMDMNKEDFEVIESGELLEKELASTNSAEIANTNSDPLDDSQTDIVEKTNYELYKCNGCNQHFLHSKTLNTHLLRPSSQKCTKKETCKYCGLDFSHLSLLKHEKQHTLKKLNLKDFRVIDQVEAGFNDLTCTFSHKKDEDESEIFENDTPIETKQDKEAFDTDNNDFLEKKITVQVKNKLYQCDKCECCFMTFTNARDHYAVCQYVQNYVECEKCQLKFHKSLSMHMKLHHETENLKLKDLAIIRYSPKNLTPLEKSLNPLKLNETLETVSTLDKKLYTNNLFKCGTCSLHFLIKESLELHTKNPELKLPKLTCTICGLAFSVNTLPTHVYIHHENMKLSTADFCIAVKDEIMDEEEDCSILPESVTNGNKKIELSTTNDQNMCDKENNESKNNFCEPDAEVVKLKHSTSSPDKALEVESSSASANGSNGNVKYEPIFFVSCDDNQQGILKSETDTVKETEMSKTVKLYKCAVCNVCFLTQTSCYRHTVKHIALDPKDYIECKLCGYQFLILNNCLHKHVTKHHKRPFKPEDVLIEEYHPDIFCHGTPKINIYYGTDKLQSKLISTTSDANISSESSECNELEFTNPDNITIDLDMDNSVNGATANIVESCVKSTDKSTTLDMDINSDIANINSADEDVNNSGNSTIDFNLHKNKDNVSLDITDKSVGDSNDSIIDLDLDSSDVISLDSDDEDSKTTCETVNIDKMVDSADTNIKTAKSN